LEITGRTRVILEPAREIPICHETDVVVVGGGPGGHSAAIAAARNGAKTVLVERYGHLGGMATGGLVILIPHLSDGTNEQLIAGLCQEWIDRLDKVSGVLQTKREEWGASDEKTVARWKRVAFAVIGGHVRHTACVDPELLKCVLNDMAGEAGVKLYLHSWGTRAIVENGVVKGVIFESKSGRQALLGKVVVDGTGDGDIMASSGAEFDGVIDRKLRSSQLALVFRLGKVDFQEYCRFQEAQPAQHEELMKQLAATAGTRFAPIASSRNDVVWVNNWISGLTATNVEDLSRIEVEVRKMMLKGYDFLKKNVPGFENSFIMDTASQVGTRGSRRLTGEYNITIDDVHNAKVYEDTIAVFPPLGPIEKQPRVNIPYRALVPKKMNGLVIGSRCFASDPPSNDMFNWIPHCIAMGEAAGTAAAMAVKQGIEPRNIDYRKLQAALKNQGVLLPGVKI
jgi:hypothetical protein